ncbi:MAG TPA: EamA family transporter, partial [Acidobacteriota bacterium]|nr:EamA family transporter [Acidobacteriota bacterium]
MQDLVVYGVVLSAVAMICWGFGDFFLQKCSRKMGDWETLFFLVLFGTVVTFFPVQAEIIDIFKHPDERLLILSITSIVLLAASLIEIESLKQGKLSVIEPVFILEIPVAGILAAIFLSERITPEQAVVATALVLGLVLVSLRSTNISARQFLEKGVMIAIVGTILMGTINFLFGLGSRETSALLVNWFTDAFLLICTTTYLLYNRKFRHTLKQIKKEGPLIFAVSVFDTAAWIAFAYALIFAPIFIVVALSQLYI